MTRNMNDERAQDRVAFFAFQSQLSSSSNRFENSLSLEQAMSIQNIDMFCIKKMNFNVA